MHWQIFALSLSLCPPCILAGMIFYLHVRRPRYLRTHRPRLHRQRWWHQLLSKLATLSKPSVSQRLTLLALVRPHTSNTDDATLGNHSTWNLGPTHWLLMMISLGQLRFLTWSRMSFNHMSTFLQANTRLALWITSFHLSSILWVARHSSVLVSWSTPGLHYHAHRSTHKVQQIWICEYKWHWSKWISFRLVSDCCICIS